MIKPEDLRRGNLVKDHNQRLARVETIGEVSIRLTALDGGYRFESINCSECEPIPLTEAILLGCGFEKNNHHKDFRMWGYAYNGTEYINTVDNGNAYFIPFGEDQKIEYLHQLQNLYHSLTQTELPVKL